MGDKPPRSLREGKRSTRGHGETPAEGAPPPVPQPELLSHHACRLVVDTKGIALDRVAEAEVKFDRRVRHASRIALEHGQPISGPQTKAGTAAFSPGGEQSADAFVVQAPLDAPGHPSTGKRKPEVLVEGLLVHEVACDVLVAEPALDDLDVDSVPNVAQLCLMQQGRDIRAETDRRGEYGERRHCRGIESRNEARSVSDSRWS